MPRLIKNTAIYTIGRLAPQVSGFVLLPVYSRYLSPDEYAFLSVAQTIVALLTILLSLGLERGVSRLLWEFTPGEQRKSFLGTLFLAGLAIPVVLLPIIYFFLQHYGILLGGQFTPENTLVILGLAFGQSLTSLPLSVLQAEGDAFAFVKANLSLFAAQMGLALCMLLFFGVPIAVLIGQLAGFILVGPMFLNIIYKRINFKWSSVKLRVSLRFTLPLMPVLLASWILTLSDRLVLQANVSHELVGLYSMAAKIASVSLLMGNSLFQSYNPIFFKRAIEIDAGPTKIAPSDLVFTNRLIAMFIGIFAAVGCIWSRVVAEVILAKSYADCAIYLPWMFVVAALYSASGFVNANLYKDKKTSGVMWVQIISAVVSVSTALFFVGRFGLWAPIVGALLANVIGLALKHHIAKLNWWVPTPWFIFSLLLVYGVLASTLILVLNCSAIMNTVLSCVISALLLGGLLWHLGGLRQIRLRIAQSV